MLLICGLSFKKQETKQLNKGLINLNKTTTTKTLSIEVRWNWIEFEGIAKQLMCFVF